MTAKTLGRLLLLSAALTLVACGGPAAEAGGTPIETRPAEVDPTEEAPAPVDDAPIAGTGLNACEIVTAQDVAAATKSDEVAPGALEITPTSLSPGHSECTYQGEFGGLIVSLTPEDGANLYDAAVGSYDGVELLDGLGDGAFFSEPNRRAFIWQGSVTVMLTIGAADGKALSQDLGKLILAKL